MGKRILVDISVFHDDLEIASELGNEAGALAIKDANVLEKRDAGLFLCAA
jgi:hypothetical protein